MELAWNRVVITHPVCILILFRLIIRNSLSPPYPLQLRPFPHTSHTPEHLQSEVARLLRACEQMRRELGGARANRAASPSPPISEAALLKPSGGNGDDAGRGGRRNEGITSVSEHHSRVTNVVLATSTHHQVLDIFRASAYVLLNEYKQVFFVDLCIHVMK